MSLDVSGLPSNISVLQGPGFSTPQSLAAFVAKRLAQAISTHGKAVLSVSGGKSPVPLYEALSISDLPWEKVTVTLVDERHVSSAHEASNARLVREHLLQNKAAAASFLPMIASVSESDLPLASLADKVDSELQTIGPAEVTILGMGEDGHTASLFPNAPSLDQALSDDSSRSCIAVGLPNPPENAPFNRLSQTLAYILQSKCIVLPIAGAAKLATLQQAIDGKSKALPVSYVLHQSEAPVFLWIAP